MKTFSYTSRDKDGRLKKGVMQAADRAGAMREVKAMGGVPLSVTEARAGTGGGFPAGRRALLWASLLVPVALAAVWFWWPAARDGKTPLGDGGKTLSARPVNPTGRNARDTMPEQPVTNVSVARQEGGETLPADMPPTARGGDASVTSVPPEPPSENVSLVFVANRKEPLFRREAEQMLALYVQPGRVVPPTPFGRGFEGDALAALAEDIVVTAEDSPEDVEQKELVAWMKDDMRKFLAGGGTVAEFFALMEKRQEEEAELLSEARRLLHELVREGDRNAALEAHRALNEVLAEKGITPLPLPGLLRRAE